MSEIIRETQYGAESGIREMVDAFKAVADQAIRGLEGSDADAQGIAHVLRGVERQLLQRVESYTQASCDKITREVEVQLGILKGEQERLDQAEHQLRRLQEQRDEELATIQLREAELAERERQLRGESDKIQQNQRLAQ